MHLTEFETMQRATGFFRPIVMAVLIVSACGTGSYNDWPYPYDYSYPYSYTDYGTFTYVRRPIGVVEWLDLTCVPVPPVPWVRHQEA